MFKINQDLSKEDKIIATYFLLSIIGFWLTFFVCAILELSINFYIKDYLGYAFTTTILFPFSYWIFRIFSKNNKKNHKSYNDYNLSVLCNKKKKQSEQNLSELYKKKEKLSKELKLEKKITDLEVELDAERRMRKKYKEMAKKG